MLIVDNISFRYKKSKTQETFGLKNINFQLEKGHVLGLLGLNGAGKSTWMNIIRGKYTLDFGRITCDDEIISEDEWGILQKIFYVSHNVDFLKFRTLRENVELFGGLYKTFNFSEWNKYMFELGFRANKLECCYNELQSDEKIKFQLSFALSCSPVLLLFDEVPVCFEKTPRECWMEKVAKGEMSVISSTQFINEAEVFYDYILILDKGEQELYVDKELVNLEKLQLNMVGKNETM